MTTANLNKYKVSNQHLLSNSKFILDQLSFHNQYDIVQSILNTGFRLKVLRVAIFHLHYIARKSANEKLLYELERRKLIIVKKGISVDLTIGINNIEKIS